MPAASSETECCPAETDGGGQLAGGRMTRRFTSKELSELNQPHNAHVAVRGKVYDISKFVAHHPGGSDQIMRGAGHDITQLFESYHSLDVYKVLEKYYVGELIDTTTPVFPETGEFYKVLKKRVAKYFKDNNLDPKIDYWMFFRYILNFVVANLSWYLMMVYSENLYVAIPLAIVWGIFMAEDLFGCGHDLSHCAITHKPWVWKILSFVNDAHTGKSLLCWSSYHVYGHHPYTNIDGVDPDIITDNHAPDIRRIKWRQKWLPRYIYQYIYIPLLYALLSVKVRVQDFHTVFSRKTSEVLWMNPLKTSDWVIFWSGKIIFFIHNFVIPAYFMSWTRVLLLNAFMDVTLSWCLAFFFEISHIVDEVEWPKPDENNKMLADWAELQVAATQDFHTDSWFWTVFTGALTHQTAHHLFPGVIQSYYPKITPIVKQTCEEFGIKYNCAETAGEAVYRHIKFLKRLGQEPDEHRSSAEDPATSMLRKKLR